jgi:protein-S-isoprenylcysteine O-methyltransferase Ste14
MNWTTGNPHIEEEKLLERFGSDYRQYMKRTGRFFPRRWA